MAASWVQAAAGASEPTSVPAPILYVSDAELRDLMRAYGVELPWPTRDPRDPKRRKLHKGTYLRARLWLAADRRCHKCGQVTCWFMSARSNASEAARLPNSATIEHVYPRGHPMRRAGTPKVLACYRCNNRGGAEWHEWLQQVKVLSRALTCLYLTKMGGDDQA